MVTNIDNDSNDNVQSNITLTNQYRLTKIGSLKSPLTTYENPVLLTFKESTPNDINHLHLQFKFTAKSIKVFQALKLFKNDLRHIEDNLLKSLEFNLFIDEYGFYFIDTNIYNNNFAEIEHPLLQLFVKIFFGQNSNYFNILTNDQRHIINDGLLFEYDMQKTTLKENSEQEPLDKKEEFFKKIIKIYYQKDFLNRDSFDILPNNELNYILDNRNDEELKRKIYNIPFLDFSLKTRKQTIELVKNWILKTDENISYEKVKFLYKLFLQDQIEKNAMRNFLEVATSITYIGQIINKIKEARDDLRTLITDTTESPNDEDTEKRVDLTEEQLARYIEKIFSKIPNLKTIDTFLQEAYYIKVGNFSFISHIEDTENITTLYQYIKWKNLLENIDNTALSLETILQVYQNRQSLEEIAELRRNELSTSDKNDVRHLSSQNQQSIVLDESQRDWFLILGVVVASTSFGKDLFNLLETYTTSAPIAIVCIILLFIFSLIKLAPKLNGIIAKVSNKPKPMIFLGINTIELRSKSKIDDINIVQKENEEFTTKVDNILSEIQKKVSGDNNSIIKQGKRRVLFTKVNPRKRTLQIKYSFYKNRDKDYFNLNDMLKICDNKNLVIKFFVVYNFTLELIKITEQNDEVYNLHNNSAKVYFNIGYADELDNETIKTCETALREKLHAIFLKEFIQ